MERYKGTKHSNARVKKGESQYNWAEIDDKTIVDAVYVKVPGHEDNLCLSALPAMEEYEKLEDKLTMCPPHYDLTEIEKMKDTEKKRSVRSAIRSVIYPISLFYDMYEMIYDCLWEVYANRDNWKRENIPAVADHKWMEGSLQSRPDRLKGRAPFFAVIGSSGNGKTLASEQVLRTIPTAILHKTGSMEFMQIPVLKAAVTAGNLSGVLDMFAMKLDEILDMGSYHADQMRKKRVFDGCLLLIQWVKDYDIGMLIIDEAQFLDFGNKSTSIENLIIVAEETGCSIGLIGNDEVMMKLEKYPRFLTRIGSNRLEANCTTQQSKNFLWNLLSTMWEYNFTNGNEELSDNAAETFLSDSLYSPAFLKDLVIRVQFEAISQKKQDEITPDFINDVCVKHFAELQSVLYLNTPDSDRRAMELLNEAEQKIDKEIMKGHEKKKDNLLKKKDRSFDSQTMSKFKTVYDVLTECKGYLKREVETAFRRKLNADAGFQSLPIPKMIDELDELLGTTMPDKKIKTPSRRPVNEKEIRDVEEARGYTEEERDACNS